jgi:2-desacetyl-2-hydroxyethyl bacteriochlorophyllide A dehydrogenase
MSKALIVRGPSLVGLEDVPDPVPGSGEISVRPTATGLCGTDLEIIDGLIDPAYVNYPLVIGHEWTGIVAGDLFGAFAAGTAVVVEGIVPCGHCDQCLIGNTNLCFTYDEIGFTRDGAAAELIVVPSRLVHTLAPGVASEDAALVEPCAVVLRALNRATPVTGSRVLVVGDGTVGLLAAHLLGLFSPAEITVLGKRPEQAALAQTMGATRFTTDAQEAGSGFDLVVEAAGATDATLLALSAVQRGGSVTLLGLPPHRQTAAVPIDDVVNNDLTIRGSFSYTSEAWRTVVGLLNDGAIHPGRVITHRFPLDGWKAAIETLRHVDGPRGKVLLDG